MESQPEFGSAFRLYLPMPLSEERTVQPIATDVAAPEYPSRGGTVLVVEDERAMVQLLRDELRCNGYEVLIAFDAEEAIDAYARYKDKIDVVLLDLGLSGLGGWDVLQT